MNAKENSLKQLRVYLFEEILKLREGTSVEKEAIALTKLSGQIISSYNTEIEALKVVNDLKDKNMCFAKSIGVIADETLS